MLKIKKILVILFTIYFLLLSSNVYAEEIELKSRAAILIDRKTGRVLFEKNSRDRMKVASLTKILTAICTVENTNMEDLVTIEKTSAYIGGSRVGLKYGSQVPVETLLYGMLLESGNDCALAVAEHISGSKEEFAKLMNSKAKEIGAKDSYFTNPHGLDEGDNHSTAYDMALIFRYAISNEYIAKIINTSAISLDFGGTRKFLSNTNRLLRAYSSCIGGKTGFTNGAYRCLLAAAKTDKMEVLTVILRSRYYRYTF